MQYESLWEVQLALGEIPGIFEKNILQPCQPQSSPLFSPPPRSQKPVLVPQNIPQRSYPQVTYTFPSITPHPFAATSFENRSEYPFSHSNDEEDDGPQYLDDEGFWAETRYPHYRSIQDYANGDIAHPSWPLVSSQNDNIAKHDYRQDRKDSGVFVYDDEEGSIQHVLPQSKEKFELEGSERLLRERVMGEDLQQMDSGSFTWPHPSLMANVSSLSSQL